MIVHTNTQVRNEAPLLKQVLPIWGSYKVDKFIFYDDRSTDDTSKVIEEILRDRAIILKKDEGHYEEGSNRSDLLEYSRSNSADIVISIDADELLTQSWLDKWDELLPIFEQERVLLPQHNVARDLRKIRKDPLYKSNYRDFVFPMKHTKPFELRGGMRDRGRHRTPRTPPIHARSVKLKDDSIGFVHLQTLNVAFYVLKQLYYKLTDYNDNGIDIASINNTYDSVINNLEFEEVDASPGIIGDWSIDSSVFDEMAEYRGYKDYILKNRNDQLITFGKEYL